MKSMFRTLMVSAGLFLVSIGVQAQERLPEYLQAEKFTSDKLRTMLFSTTVDPHWFQQGNSFWYTYKTSEGTFWYVVNPNTRSKQLLFNREEIAAQLTEIVKDPFEARQLPIRNLKAKEDGRTFTFEVTSTKDAKPKKGEKKDKRGHHGSAAQASGGKPLRPRLWPSHHSSGRDVRRTFPHCLPLGRDRYRSGGRRPDHGLYGPGPVPGGAGVQYAFGALPVPHRRLYQPYPQLGGAGGCGSGGRGALYAPVHPLWPDPPARKALSGRIGVDPRSPGGDGAFQGPWPHSPSQVKKSRSPGACLDCPRLYGQHKKDPW